MPLKENPTIKVLASIFENKIIPLLQEYFYEDYRKIQLVLGDNGKENPKHKFIVDLPGGREKIFGGNIDLQEFVPDVKYQINPDAFSTLASYIGIFPVPINCKMLFSQVSIYKPLVESFMRTSVRFL